MFFSYFHHLHLIFIIIIGLSFDCEKVLRGRPYGGCAFLWRRSLDVKVKLIEVPSKRIIAVTIEYSSFTILLANVYMPYECSNDNALYDDFCYQLGVLDGLMDSHTVNNTHVLLAGDWNVDFCKSELYKPLLNDFIDKHGLLLAMMWITHTTLICNVSVH
jgi:exonuclease III